MLYIVMFSVIFLYTLSLFSSSLAFHNSIKCYDIAFEICVQIVKNVYKCFTPNVIKSILHVEAIYEVTAKCIVNSKALFPQHRFFQYLYIHFLCQNLCNFLWEFRINADDLKVADLESLIDKLGIE